ncbi:MAG TPA: cytochrome o ubiquinol oxidase subunit IV [Parachlamydiaceae bacterium]|nr:cytochrome o ubiquinol oxidase subunit IV [Parachlamydiaceae bacterium]
MALEKIQKEWHGNYKSYFLGFILSLFLTILSFYLSISNKIELKFLLLILGSLAVLQAVLQLIFFLHLGTEEKPRYYTNSFIFTVVILLAVLIGSIWVMNDLYKRMMADMMPHQHTEMTH